MKDCLTLGSSPADEKCAQVGADNYHQQARHECNVLIRQLMRMFGSSKPPGATLGVKSFPHDFGSYLEVVCFFDDQDEAAVDWAYKLENDFPENWDEEARKELKETKQ